MLHNILRITQRYKLKTVHLHILSVARWYLLNIIHSLRPIHHGNTSGKISSST
jgi:hypothetical protein